MKGSCANTAGNGGRVEVVTNHTPSRPGHDVKLSTQSGGEVFLCFHTRLASISNKKVGYFLVLWRRLLGCTDPKRN